MFWERTTFGILNGNFISSTMAMVDESLSVPVAYCNSCT